MANEFLTPPAPEPAKKGKLTAKTLPEPDMGGFTEQLNLMSARMRVSEERNSEIRKKLLFVEQNMLTNHKKAMTEIKTLQQDLLELKRTIQNVEDKIIMIIKELRLTSRKEDVDVMRRYIEIWNPVNFVTRDQLDKILNEKHEKKTAEKPPRYDSP